MRGAARDGATRGTPVFARSSNAGAPRRGTNPFGTKRDVPECAQLCPDVPSCGARARRRETNPLHAPRCGSWDAWPGVAETEEDGAMSIRRSERGVVLNYRAEPDDGPLAWWERVAAMVFVLALPVLVVVMWLAYMGREC